MRKTHTNQKFGEDKYYIKMKKLREAAKKKGKKRRNLMLRMGILYGVERTRL